MKENCFAYDNSSLLLTDINMCDVMYCANYSQALQRFPVSNSSKWIDTKTHQGTTPNSDWRSKLALNKLRNQQMLQVFASSLCWSDTAPKRMCMKFLCCVDRERTTKRGIVKTVNYNHFTTVSASVGWRCSFDRQKLQSWSKATRCLHDIVHCIIHRGHSIKWTPATIT